MNCVFQQVKVTLLIHFESKVESVTGTLTTCLEQSKTGNSKSENVSMHSGMSIDGESFLSGSVFLRSFRDEF